jgi:hypothetical protein
MAIPISAFFKAGASLTPSPVIAETLKIKKVQRQHKVVKMAKNCRKYQIFLKKILPNLNSPLSWIASTRHFWTFYASIK